ncbi:MAG TPA: S53 family peptidase [Trebonia sp.]|jgi:subtilase family serine protease
MARSIRLGLSAGLAAGAVIAAVPIAATAASAATRGGPGAFTRVPGSVTAKSLPHATPEGSTAAATPETISIILKANDLRSLESKVTNGYYDARNYLSTSRFASAYGQAKTAAALSAYLAKYGITTTTYKDDLDVSATGTASEFNRALDVKQNEYRVAAVKGTDGHPGIPAQTVHAVDGAPALPSSIASDVLAVLGLTNYSSFVSEATHGPSDVTVKSSGSTAVPYDNLPSNFASEYGLNPLYKKANGSGQTIAIVTLAALDQGAPEYFWKNVEGISHPGTVSVDNIDGGPGAPSDADGTGETDLDVEQSGGLAPGANVIVYQAPNTDPGFADAFYTAASQNVASTVSSSWGEAETYIQWAVEDGIETPAYQSAFDEVFLEYAAQGQSSFIAAGDDGAYDDYYPGETPSTSNLTVDSPGDSPYVTDAGGTTNAFSDTVSNTEGTVSVPITVKSQRAWSWDYLWAPFAAATGESLTATALDGNIGGGGGGYSETEARPSYQHDIPGISTYTAVNDLTPTDDETITGSSLTEPTSFTAHPKPSVVTGENTTGRAVPDVSADADPLTGYLLYEPSATQSGGEPLEGDWGGTSFVAPQLNGSTAEIDSYLGHRVGFWNPAVYSFATSGHDPFTPLDTIGTGNDNLYYTGNGTGSRYNPGSGLGTPDLNALAADFKASGR